VKKGFVVKEGSELDYNICYTQRYLLVLAY